MTGTINKLCTLYLPLKSETIPSPVTIVKSHKNKFRVTTSPTTKVWGNVAESSNLKRFIQEKMMDFDYCEEYLRSISNKMLLWQC